MCGTSRLRSLKDVATMANVETKSGPKVENLAVVVRLPGNLAGAAGPFTGVGAYTPIILYYRRVSEQNGHNK
jgi:hypothetical protein